MIYTAILCQKCQKKNQTNENFSCKKLDLGSMIVLNKMKFMNYEEGKREKNSIYMADEGSNEFMIKVSYPKTYISVWK